MCLLTSFQKSSNLCTAKDAVLLITTSDFRNKVVKIVARYAHFQEIPHCCNQRSTENCSEVEELKVG